MCTEFCLAKRNSAHVLVSARISRLLDTCLSVIHNANYIVNSIVCAVILVRGIRVPSYGIRPTHGPIHVVNMHGTGNKHIVRHSQKSVVQWSVISKFTCIHMTNTLYASDWEQAYRPSYAKICRTGLRHIQVHLYILVSERHSCKFYTMLYLSLCHFLSTFTFFSCN